MNVKTNIPGGKESPKIQVKDERTSNKCRRRLMSLVEESEYLEDDRPYGAHRAKLYSMGSYGEYLLQRGKK